MKEKAVIIVAHPDDEVLFFSSILDQKDMEKYVICITDGNADNRGNEREEEFRECMNYFKVSSFEKYNLPDKYDEDLEIETLNQLLSKTFKEWKIEKQDLIFTHGPFGDYGHPHHITASYCVHQLSQKLGIDVYTPNILELPKAVSFVKEEEVIKVWKNKLYALMTFYKKEYQRFVSLIPARANETFIKSDSETFEVLDYLTRDIKLGKLSRLAPFRESLVLFKEHRLKRSF